MTPFSVERFVGSYTPSEACLVIRPIDRPGEPAGKLRRVVVIGHGYNVDTTFFNPAASRGYQYQWQPLTDAGFIVVVPEMAGSTTFGNDASQTALAACVTWALTLPRAKTDKVVIFGVSAGTLTGLMYAKANPTKVIGYIGTLPAVSLADVHDNNRGGLGTTIETAHGGLSAFNAGKATHDPNLTAASFTTLPGFLAYSTTDPLIPTSVVTTFAATTGHTTAAITGTTGHDDTTFDFPQIVRFLKKNNLD